jgi:hypothetical protein
MECSACLGTCQGDCKVCKGLCGSGKPKKVCLTKKEFVGEHKHLIGLLSEVGKEGRKQAKELKKITGKGTLEGHPMAPAGKTVEEVFRWHYNMGHDLEHLLTHQDGRKVTYNLFWKPSTATVNKLNKMFLTFRFHTNGTLSAVRGRQFARDAEILIRMMNKEELDGKGHAMSRLDRAIGNFLDPEGRVDKVIEHNLQDKLERDKKRRMEEGTRRQVTRLMESYHPQHPYHDVLRGEREEIHTTRLGPHPRHTPESIQEAIDAYELKLHPPSCFGDLCKKPKEATVSPAPSPVSSPTGSPKAAGGVDLDLEELDGRGNPNESIISRIDTTRAIDPNSASAQSLKNLNEMKEAARRW